MTEGERLYTLAQARKIIKYQECRDTADGHTVVRVFVVKNFAGQTAIEVYHCSNCELEFMPVPDQE